MQPAILSFYDGNTKAPFDSNDPSTTLDDVLKWDDDTLERRHDFIQYLFPLPEPSGVNPSAPLITREVRNAFKADPGLKDQLLRAVHRMRQFYCLEDIPPTPIPSDPRDFELENPNSIWLQTTRAKIAKHHDHNHLRLTRMIRCLRVLDCREAAKILYCDLRGIDASFGRPVASSTIEYWDAAMKWPLCRVPNLHKNQIVEWLRDEVEEVDGDDEYRWEQQDEEGESEEDA